MTRPKFLRSNSFGRPTKQDAIDDIEGFIFPRIPRSVSEENRQLYEGLKRLSLADLTRLWCIVQELGRGRA